MIRKCPNDKTALELKNDKVKGTGLNKFDYLKCFNCGYQLRTPKKV